MSETVVGRFAPTPSGRMHAGNVFAALMAWLGVRSAGGRMVLRIEDLDSRAHRPEATRQLLDDLRWLGLDWDEGPYYQSKRTEVYVEALRSLKERGLTYPCFCTRAELHAATASCRTGVSRILRTPSLADTEMSVIRPLCEP